MRTTPLVGTKLWFVPRDDGWGWGWKPASWEGRVVVGGFLITVLGAALVLDGGVAAVVTGVAVAVLLSTAVLKGTSPGGRRQAARFNARRDHGERTATAPRPRE